MVYAITRCWSSVMGGTFFKVCLLAVTGWRGGILLMEEILHRLRLVVYPIIYKVLAPSQVVSRISSINSSISCSLYSMCMVNFSVAFLCYFLE